MDQRIGACSLCGGDVVGFRGAWMATVPPPPDRCTSCGARRAEDVIPMTRPNWTRTATAAVSVNGVPIPQCDRCGTFHVEGVGCFSATGVLY